MHVSQCPYRKLCDILYEYDGSALYQDFLAPWVKNNPAELDWLASFSSNAGDSAPHAEIEDLWRLYALGRVNELLLLRFQQGQADGTPWPGPPITSQVYVAFAESLGLIAEDERPFSPFYHEIVKVELDPREDQPVTLTYTVWPCLMLGDMVFSRAGVNVTGGTRFIRKEVAESSTLYWAYRRKNRSYQDLSHGWGSNSQWRTKFRRDYRIGEEYFYNVDGKHDLAKPDQREEEDRDGLAIEERIELLTNRCFIKTSKPHDDLWPYDDTCSTPIR